MPRGVKRAVDVADAAGRSALACRTSRILRSVMTISLPDWRQVHMGKSDCVRPLDASMKEATTVGIGVSIFLIAIGAIFTFALDVNVGWLDLDVVGWVLMLAGVVGLLLTLWFWQSRKRTTVVRDTRAATPQPTGPRHRQRRRRRAGSRNTTRYAATTRY